MQFIPFYQFLSRSPQISSGNMGTLPTPCLVHFLKFRARLNIDWALWLMPRFTGKNWMITLVLVITTVTIYTYGTAFWAPYDHDLSMSTLMKNPLMDNWTHKSPWKMLCSFCPGVGTQLSFFHHFICWSVVAILMVADILCPKFFN